MMGQRAQPQTEEERRWLRFSNKITKQCLDEFEALVDAKIEALPLSIPPAASAEAVYKFNASVNGYKKVKLGIDWLRDNFKQMYEEEWSDD